MSDNLRHYLMRFPQDTFARIAATVAGLEDRRVYQSSERRLTVQEFVSKACLAECRRLERRHNDGHRWPPAEIRRGAPKTIPGRGRN